MAKATYPHGDDRLLDRIDTHPAILGGRPFVRGSRLSVEEVLGILAASDTADISAKLAGSVEPDDIRACIEYARRVLTHEHLIPLDSIAGVAVVSQIGAAGVRRRTGTREASG